MCKRKFFTTNRNFIEHWSFRSIIFQLTWWFRVLIKKKSNPSSCTNNNSWWAFPLQKKKYDKTVSLRFPTSKSTPDIQLFYIVFQDNQSSNNQLSDNRTNLRFEMKLVKLSQMRVCMYVCACLLENYFLAGRRWSSAHAVGNVASQVSPYDAETIESWIYIAGYIRAEPSIEISLGVVGTRVDRFPRMQAPANRRCTLDPYHCG